MLVGNTPMLAVEFSVDRGEPRRVYAKAESLNMTGSIKDRMALHIIRRAYESGERPATTQAFHSALSAARSATR